MSANYFRQWMGNNSPVQEFHEITYKYLPNNQRVIIKKEVYKINENNRLRAKETHEYPEPHHCANPYGLHKYRLVYDGHNGLVNKEKEHALCFECLKVRYPHQFKIRGHMPLPWKIPKHDPSIDEEDDFLKGLKLEGFEEELPPLEIELPPLDKYLQDEIKTSAINELNEIVREFMESKNA